MKQTISITLIIAMILGVFINCPKEKKDNTALIAGALLLSNQRRSGATGLTTVSGTTTQQRQVSTARQGAQGAASAARASSGRTAMYLDKKMGEFGKELMAFSIQKSKGSKIKFNDYMALKSQINAPKSIVTFAQCTDGNNTACDGTDTNMTYNGSRSCTKGGTMTATNFRVTYAGATQDSLQMTMDGAIAYAACKEDAVDFQNYPNTTPSTITSGATTVKGTYSYSDTTTGTNFVIEEKNDYTVNSTTDMVFVAGSTAQKIENLTSKTSLKTTFNFDTLEYLGATGNSLCKGITACSPVDFTTVYGSRASYVIDGTLAIAGKVGGADAGMNLTLSNKSIVYSVKCTKPILQLTDADYAEGSTTCAITVQ